MMVEVKKVRILAVWLLSKQIRCTVSLDAKVLADKKMLQHKMLNSLAM